MAKEEGRVEIAVVIMMAASVGAFIAMSVMPKKKEHNNYN